MFVRAVLVAVCVVFAFAAFYCGLIIRRYQLGSRKLAEGQRLNIALIADLHSRAGRKRLEKLLAKVQAENPDIIVLAGDIFDSKKSMSGAEAFLSALPTIAPVFYAFGNHEYRSGKIGAIRKTAQRCHITLLEDEIKEITINGITLRIAGIADGLKSKYDCVGYDLWEAMDTAFCDLDDSRYNILIAHRAYYVSRYKKYPFDLILSGHAHGGQWRIPFLINGLFVPSQGLFPRYAGGAYHHGETTHIVSRGVSVTAIVPRIFNPPELVMVYVGNKTC